MVEQVKNRSEQGFTLAEVIIAITLFAIVMGVTYRAFWVVNTSQRRGEMQTDMQQNARIAMDVMVRDLREAAEVEVYEVYDAEDGTEVAAGVEGKAMKLVDHDSGEAWYYLNPSGTQPGVIQLQKDSNVVAYGFKEDGFIVKRHEGDLVTVQLTAVDARGKEYTLKTSVHVRAPE